MEKLRLYLECFVEWFVSVATGILIICAVNFELCMQDGVIPSETLLQILLSAMLTSAVTAAFHMADPVKRSSVLLCLILHFCCLVAVMEGCGIWFGWVDFEVFGMFDMVLSVACVYGFVMAVHFIIDKRRAEQMNHRLWERYHKDEEGDRKSVV